MPSSTDPGRAALLTPLTGLGDSVRDLKAILAFRFGGGSRRRAWIGLAIMAAITLYFATFPAFMDLSSLPERLNPELVADQIVGAFPAFLAITLISAVAAGGGREVLSRDQAVAYPISPATDHLGALVMAPLNLAWLVQLWLLLATAAFIAGPDAALLPGAVLIVLWVVFATAAAQLMGWVVEYVRRGPYGRILVIGAGIALMAGSGLLVATGTMMPLMRALPTAGLVDAIAAGGYTLSWAGWVAGLTIGSVVLVLAGVLPAVPRWSGVRPATRNGSTPSGTRPAATPSPTSASCAASTGPASIAPSRCGVA